jgi:Ca2+-binding EF-hand superfamily protein
MTKSKIGESLDDDMWASIMREADPNQDGQITFEEFKSMMIDDE